MNRNGRRAMVLVAITLVATGCGGDDAPEQSQREQAGTEQPAEQADPKGSVVDTTPAGEPVAEPKPKPRPKVDPAKRPAGEDGLRVPAARARVVLDRSQFGQVLFDANGQVVYAFEQDRRNRSRCVNADCVKAWPPMLTKGPPTAGPGVDASLLGTIKRNDGTLQVTYAGRPLYFYEHEGPGEVTCHEVDLHGGLWWVVRADGRNA